MSSALERLKQISKKTSKDEVKELRDDVDKLEEAVNGMSEAVTDALSDLNEAIKEVHRRMDILQNKPVNIDATTRIDGDVHGDAAGGDIKK